MTRRTKRFLIVFFLIAVSVVAVPVGLRFWRLRSYALQQRAGAALIGTLSERRPESVPTKTWEDATGWAKTAFHNVCFSERQVKFEELVRFNHDARVKFAGEVDLNSIDWVWSRLAETGPHGQRYVEKFEPEYRSFVDGSQSANTR
jgi:hypothetical protein